MKKFLLMLGAVALALTTGFTMTACGGGGGGGGVNAGTRATMNTRDFGRGAKMFQLLPNNGVESELYCVSNSANEVNENQAVCAGRMRAGGKMFNVYYTYTKVNETTYTLTITNNSVENVKAPEFVEALGFGTTLTGDDEGQFIASNIDSLSGMTINFTFNMATHMVNVESRMIVEDQEAEPPFHEEIYRNTDMVFRVLPCTYN